MVAFAGRALSRLGIAGVAVVVILVAFLGGALSGKLEPKPSTRSAPPKALSPVAVLEADVVHDMTLDIESQTLDVNLGDRAREATSPDAVLQRNLDITSAWAPDQVVGVEAQHRYNVLTMAADPTNPSITGGEFLVSSWTSEAITGAAATVVVVGHYVVDEPGNHAVPNGVLVEADQSWQLTLRRVNGAWLMEQETA